MTGYFVNRESGAFCRVMQVDNHYALLQIDQPDGTQTRYAMPIADYDGFSANRIGHFTALWREATPEDLAAMTPPPSFRPPGQGQQAELPHESDGVTIADDY
jgi:hypothetical protein